MSNVKKDNKLLELADFLKEMRDKKQDIEKELKGLSEEITGIETELIDMMTNEELSSFKRNGVNFSLVVQEFPSAILEKKDELYDVMKAEGYEHLFTINSQTLQATIKELMSNNDGIIPKWLDGLIKVAEKSVIRITKTKKY